MDGMANGTRIKEWIMIFYVGGQGVVTSIGGKGELKQCEVWHD